MEKIGLAAVMNMANFDKGQKQYNSGLGKMTSATETTSKKTTAALGQIGAFMTGILGAQVVRAAAGYVKEMVSMATSIPPIATAFRNLGGSIEEMREGSMGMIADVDLMKSFNQASALVSEDFAKKLPEAMGYLAKVSASTGESMTFMMDSIVRGVGRMSPMILDNLGIQVDMTAANKEYAAVLGITTGEMSKTQKQTALMNQVMEKLAFNTAKMPDVAGTAAAQMASLGVTMENIKAIVGQALLPVLQQFMDILTPLAEQLRDVAQSTEFQDTMQKIGDSIAWVIEHVQGFSSGTVEMIEKVGAVVLAIGALGAAFTLLSGPAGPIILVSMAVLALIELYDKLEKKQEAIAATMTETSTEVAQTAQSYDEYVKAMIDARREQDGYSKTLSDGRIRLQLLADGLIVSKLEFQRQRGEVELTTMSMSDNAEMQARLAKESKYGLEPAVRDVAESFVEATAQLEEYQHMNELLPPVVTEVITSMVAVQESIQKALASEKITDQLIKIQQAIGKQETAMLAMQTKYDADVAKKQFEHDRKMLLARQKYDQEYARLIAAGRMDDANKLTAQFNRTKAISQREYAAAQQLQKIALVRKQIERVRANIIELQGMRDQTLRVLQEQIKAETAKGKQLTQDQIKTLRLIATYGSAQLQLETEIYIDRAAAFVDFGKTQLRTAQTIAAGLASITTEEDAADTAINALNAQLAVLQNAVNNLPPITLPPLDLPDVPSGGDISAITEPATTAMSQVVNDIAQAVSAAKDAIADLVEFELPAGVETGLERVAEFIQMAVEGFYAIHDAIGPKLVDVKAMLAPAKQLLDVVASAVKAMSGFGTDETLSLPDMENWANQLRGVLGAITDVILDMRDSVGRWDIIGAGGLAGSIEQIAKTIKPLNDALRAMSEFQAEQTSGDIEAWGTGVRRLIAAVADVILNLKDSVGRWELIGAGALADSIGNIVGVVKGGIDALASLATFSPEAASPVEDFVLALRRLVDGLKNLPDLNTEDEFEDIRTFWANVADLVGVVKPGVDALIALGGFESEMMVDGEAFVNALKSLSDDLQSLDDIDFENEFEDMRAFWDRVADLIDIVKPGVDALLALTSFEEEMSFSGEAFANALRTLSDDLKNVQDINFEDEFVDIRAFWDRVKDLIDIVKPGVDALIALGEFDEAMTFSGAAFADALVMVAQQLRDAVSDINLEQTLTEASDWWGEVIELIKIVKPGIAALAELGKYTKVEGLAQKWADFEKQLLFVAVRISGLAGTMDTEYLPDATAFRDGMKMIQELFKEGIGYLGGVGVEGIDSVLLAIDRFKVSLWRLMGSLGDTVSRGLDGIHSAIWAAIPSAHEAGFAYGLALGNSIVQGYMAGIGQMPALPNANIPANAALAATAAGAGGATDNSVNVNMYGDVNNGMDLATMQGKIRQTVRDAMRS